MLRRDASSSGKVPWWFGIPFILGGIVALGFGAVLLQDELRFGTDGVPVTGTVLDTKYFSGGSDSGPSYTIVYTFIDPATGARHDGESDVEESVFDRAEPGQPIDITYLPANPQKSRVGSPDPQLLIPFAILGMGLLFIVVGGGMTLLARWQQRHGSVGFVTMSFGDGGTDDDDDVDLEGLPEFL